MAAGTQVTGGSPSGALTTAQLRHLLRRMVFSSTPAAQRAFAGRTASQVLDMLVDAAGESLAPDVPVFVGQAWTNPALRTPGMTDVRYDALRAAQLASARADTDRLRQWWIAEMVSTPAPLRENLTLFFHGTFGSTTGSVDAPQALYGCNALLRRLCLGTIPALLEALVLEPAMLMQIGMDEHRKLRVSDRPAKLILDYWTVGAGHYQDADVESLSRALTGWTLTTPPGVTPATVDPAAPRHARRAGLVPSFEPAQFDARPKTLLGATDNFDARAALRLLALHPNTARRICRLLLLHFGVEDPQQRLQGQLAATYLKTGGAMKALLHDLVEAPEFWSDTTRWALIKSPVHLAVAACRQLDLGAPPVETLVPWIAACGQTLFDTPNSGEGGWPGDTAWVTPPDRLAIRYQLPAVLSGTPPRLGLEKHTNVPAVSIDISAGAAVQREPAARLVERLDPAPGLDGAARGRHMDVIRRVMMSPQYQLA